MQINEQTVFISYARANSVFALKLTGDLRAMSVDVWLDQLDIPAGDQWDNSVEFALKKCPCILCILSPAAVDSQNVMDEISFGIEKKKKIVPVLYQKCEVPFRLRRRQHIDFTVDYNSALNRLRTTLNSLKSVAVLPQVPFQKPLPAMLVSLPVDTIRLKGKETFRGYGFFTPQGYIILDRIPFEREKNLLGESPTRTGEGPLTLELVRFATSIPIALARPVGLALKGHPMSIRPTGSLAIGETIELYRGSNYTTSGKVLRKSVDVDISGAHGKETHNGLLETTKISTPGDSGAPVIDLEKRVVGMLYAGSSSASVIVPIELIMSAFPEAF